MKNKLAILLIVLFIIVGCSSEVADQPDDTVPQVDDSLDEVEATIELPDNFPVVSGAKLSSYFEFFGMYQYTYEYSGSMDQMRDELIGGLFDIGIVASGYSFSQYATGESQDIIMSDGSADGYLGYIVLHTDESNDFNDIVGYTVTVSEQIFNYEPFEIPLIEQGPPEDISIYKDAFLYDYQDRRDLFEANELFNYVYLIDYFSGNQELGEMLAEYREIHDFYLNDLNDRGYEVEENGTIVATNDDVEVRVRISPFYIGGSVHGAQIEIIK
jgi:hypothetical protein